ncbi:MAG TPA: beta-phosphoglucomutase family hydrolase [Gemmatimonadaceae bacterium]
MVSADRIDLGPFRAFLFDLDGVVTDTARVHATAWKRLFDDYLSERAKRTGTPFKPFDPVADYLQYVDGKLRQDGAESFLQSRGIDLPMGSPHDGPDVETVNGLANRKDRYFTDALEHHGVEAFDGTVRFIRDAHSRGIHTAIVSSSRNCAAVVSKAGLTALFETRVDGLDIRNLHLRGKPAPDTYLEAARRLHVTADQAAIFEDAVAGVEAGQAGHFRLVVGIGEGAHAADLRAHGAGLVVGDLGTVELLDGGKREH